MSRSDRYRSFDEELSPVATSLIEWFPPVRQQGRAAAGGPVISSRNRRSASPDAGGDRASSSSASTSSSLREAPLQAQQPSGGSSFQVVVSSSNRFPALHFPRRSWQWWSRANLSEGELLSSVGSSVQLGSQGQVGAAFHAELACRTPRFGSLVARAQTLQSGPANLTIEAASPGRAVHATLQLDSLHATHNAFATFFSNRPSSFIRDVTIGYGVLVKRHLGANLLTGFAARIGQRVTAQAHVDALRRLCCSISESGVLLPNLDAAVRLRMNLISFERTEFDFALAYKIFLGTASRAEERKPDMTVHASWSSAGIAAGVSLPSLVTAQRLAAAAAGRNEPPATQSSWLRHVLEHVGPITVGVVAATDSSRSTQFFAAITAE